MSNLFGWGDQIWQTIDQIGIMLGVAMGVTWFIGLILAAIKPDSLRRWFTRNRFPSIGGRPDIDWQGLIFTVSRYDVPLWVVEQVRPQMVGLLSTASRQKESDLIRTHVESRGVKVTVVTIENPDDPAEVSQKTKELLRFMQDNGISPVAVDITGGKTPTSVGAFMAAEESSADTIYVTTDYKDKKPDMATARIIAISQAGSHR